MMKLAKMKSIVLRLFLLVFLLNEGYGAEAQDMTADSFQFAWLSDIHIVESGSPSVKDLRASITDINKNKEVCFTIITGDIADFGEDSILRVAKGLLDSLRMPYYIVPGNHDTKWSASGATAFTCIFGHRNISFNYGNIDFIGFQTGPILRRGYGYIAPEDFEWVKNECEKAREKGRVIIPFTHYPLTKSMSNWYKLTSLFRQYRVPLVLSGHLHRYEFIMTGGIANVVNTRNVTRGKRLGGYTVVRVNKDSMYFYKRNPTTQKTISWLGLPDRATNYKAIPLFKPDFSVNKKYPNIKPVWKKRFPAGISSKATLSGNKLIVGDRAGILHCLSLSSGEQLWRYKSGKAIFSTPAVSDNKVVFGSVDGYVYCIDLNHGRLVWKFKTNNYVLGAPAVKDTVVYIGSSDWKFRAIDLQTGKLLWVFDGLKAWVQTKPVIYKGKVLFGCWDNNFYALDQKTGKLVWKWERSSRERYPSAFYAPGACWPVAAHDKVFFTRPDLTLTALDVQTGKLIWERGTPRLNEALGISEDGSKLFVKTSYDSTLLAYSTSSDTAEVVWKTTAHYGFDNNESAIIEQNNIVYYPLLNGKIIATNSLTGKILWVHRMSAVMPNSVTPVSKNEVVISDIDGNIQLLRNVDTVSLL